MPYKAEKSDRCPSDKPWACINEVSGRVMGCHPTKKDAEKQMAALYAVEPMKPIKSAYDVEQLDACPNDTWAFPAPKELAVIQQTPNYYSIHWQIVEGPNGQTAKEYTVATYNAATFEQVDWFTTPYLHASIPGGAFRSPLPMGEYRTYVWASDSPDKAGHAEITVTIDPFQE